MLDAIPMEVLPVAIPLAVDMDGTLLRTDVFLEGVVAALFRRPLAAFRNLPLLFGSRAAFKAKIAETVALDIDVLPVREVFLDHLAREKARGRPIYLVTAANQRIARSVSRRFDIFTDVFASSETDNLKGARKRERLHELFPGGFAYAGDSAADLKVWEGAASILIVGATRGVARRAIGMGKPLEAMLEIRRFSFRRIRKALRLHQWSKNVLILVPQVLGNHLTDVSALANCVAGFFLMGIAASATYLINDLADLESDRCHRSKRHRPLASGDLPIAHAIIAAPLMLLFAVVGAFLLSPGFALVLLAYLVITLSYSTWFKRVPLLDVMVLGGLYTTRMVGGTLLSHVVFSPWLLTFAFFFFFSMSLAKRHVEVSSSLGPPDEAMPGRGYRPADAPLTLSLGVATSAAAVLIVVQYMMAEAFPSDAYRFPAALWAAPMLLSLWICRIWLLAHRGELADDPVAFAMKDRLSLLIGLILGIFFLVARL